MRDESSSWLIPSIGEGDRMSDTLATTPRSHALYTDSQMAESIREMDAGIGYGVRVGR